MTNGGQTATVHVFRTSPTSWLIITEHTFRTPTGAIERWKTTLTVGRPPYVYGNFPSSHLLDEVSRWTGLSSEALGLLGLAAASVAEPEEGIAAGVAEVLGTASTVSGGVSIAAETLNTLAYHRNPSAVAALIVDIGIFATGLGGATAEQRLRRQAVSLGIGGSWDIIKTKLEVRDRGVSP